MINSFYSKEDSDEVKKVYFAAVRKSGEKRIVKTIVSKKEFDNFLKIGAQMDRFETMSTFKNRVKKQITEKDKENANAKHNNGRII